MARHCTKYMQIPHSLRVHPGRMGKKYSTRSRSLGIIGATKDFDFALYFLIFFMSLWNSNSLQLRGHKLSPRPVQTFFLKGIS